MNINEFVNERKEEWEKLERISAKVLRRTGKGLTSNELWELGTLYTAAISDLSTLKSSSVAADLNPDILNYLTGLVIRVHGAIYKKPPIQKRRFLEFFTAGFPRAVRKSLGYVLLSAGLFTFFGVMGFILGLGEPGFIELVVPEQIIEVVQSGKVWFKDIHTVAPLASSALMTHNISVVFLAIAAGITFGAGTAYLMALNGLLLGAVASLCYTHGLSVEFWSFVLPHGSLELSAVIIAGAAGLLLGHALIDPGQYRRADYLAVRGREVGKLALGCVPLLICAGFIEAFFSPSPLPVWLKFLFAGISFMSLVTYLSVVGRSRAE